jgi:hypothetical protein
MSKHADLTRTHWEARESSARYHEVHLRFAHDLVQGLLKYLEVPPEQFAYHPLDAQPAPGTRYTVAGASGFMEDRFFHVRFAIGFQKAPNTFPIPWAVLEIRIRRAGDAWLVRVLADGPDHTIADPTVDLPKLYEIISLDLSAMLSHRTQDFIEHVEQKKQIGFIRDQESDDDGAA